jgi:IS66 C-terminal element/Transposase IS66 family
MSSRERTLPRQIKFVLMVPVLEAWLREQRCRLSCAASAAQPIDYMLKRLDDFARCLGNGRICLTNNAAEALRGFALGRKCWLFVAPKAAPTAPQSSLIVTAKLNDIDQQARLADVLARINDHAINRLDQLVPWNGSRPTDHVNWRHDRRFSFDMAGLFDVAGAPKGVMTPMELDGYLIGIVVSPDLLPPSRWIDGIRLFCTHSIHS